MRSISTLPSHVRRRLFGGAGILPAFSLIVVFIAALSTSGCTKTVVAEKLPPVVSVGTVQQFAPTQEDRYSAVVMPATQVDLAFRAGGYVDSIHRVRGVDGRFRNVQEGDFIRRGTVLARLRQSDYVLRVRQQSAAIDEIQASDQRARANLDEGNASLQQAREEFERSSRLYQSNSITKPEYEAASTKLAVCEARVHEAAAQLNVNKATVRRAGAGLDEARLALHDCALIAPTDGTILKRSIEEGTLASNGTVAFTVADTQSVKVAFGLPDVKLKDVRLGQNLPVITEAVPGEVFRGMVTDIAPAADPKSRVFNVEVTIPNRKQLLRPGMVASLQTDDPRPQVSLPAVPLTAIIKSSATPDGYAVFVVRDQGGKVIVEEQPVKLGEASGQLITVLEGLSLAERVVVNGTNKIATGQEVRIVN
jgi:membrane fusion protein, multidrug efflux system